MHVMDHSLMHRWLTVVKSSLSIAHAGNRGHKARVDSPQGGHPKGMEGGERGKGRPHGNVAA